MKPQLILFDFDGTLADSFGAMLAAGNRLATLHGYSAFTETEAIALRSQSIRRIIKESDVPLRRLPAWIRDMKRELAREVPNINPPAGMSEALATLHDHGIQLGIVTSNDLGNVKLFLENHGWLKWFSNLETGSNLFGKSRLIRRSLEHTEVAADGAVYVGDEERDVAAARKAEVTSIAVTWGFNDRYLLSRSCPDHIIDSPEELPLLLL